MSNYKAKEDLAEIILASLNKGICDLAAHHVGLLDSPAPVTDTESRNCQLFPLLGKVMVFLDLDTG